MSNLANKPPLGLKVKREKKDEKYLQKIRARRCVICQKFGEIQLSPTTAHHPIHDRFGTHKRADSTAIPLCEDHHQGLWGNDPSKIAIHKSPLKWREKYGADYEYSEDQEQL